MKIKLGKEILGHFQSGVSYIIPLLSASGLITSLAVIIGGSEVWETTDTFWGVVRMIGHTGLQFLVPMIAAYIAYSIADRPGLVPAFICGMIANEMGTGFLGGMIVGVMVGYVANYLKKIPLPGSIVSLKGIMVIPFLTTFICGLVLWFVIGGPIVYMTSIVEDWLNGLSGGNMAILGAILGAMMAFDMGGPINKIANAFGIASFSTGAFLPSTLVLIAISIPPAGMFLATLLRKDLYDQEDLDNGKAAIAMGLVGITEGTIPFAVKDPLRVIPSIMVGTAVSSALCGFFGIYVNVLLATFMAIPLVTNPFLYLLCIATGVIITALMVNFLKSMSQKKLSKETN